MLRKLVGAASVTVVLSALVVTAQAQRVRPPPAYETYFNEMKKAGFTAQIPVDNLHGPGYIYRIVATPNGPRQRTVCLVAFNQPPIESQQRAPPVHHFSDNGFSASVSLAPGAVADGVSGKLGAQLGRIRTVDLTFGDMQPREIALPFGADDKGGEANRTIHRDCAPNLRALRAANGKFTEPLYLVYRAVAANRFRYDLDSTGSAGIDLGVDVETVGSAQAGWKLKRIDKQAFEVVNDGSAPPMYIATDIVVLKSADQLNRVGRRPRYRVAYIRPNEDESAAAALAPPESPEAEPTTAPVSPPAKN